MSLFKLIFDGLRHYAPIHGAVALAVAVATAVWSGALVVGDSVRGSLTHLTLDRLGRVESVLLGGDRLFNADLAERWGPSLKAFDLQALPAMLLEGSLERPAGDAPARAGAVAIIATGPEFWSLGAQKPAQLPGDGEIVLNAPLAERLGVKPGEDVILRIGASSDVPAESALGRKTETTRSRRLTVSAIVPAEGLGRFGLRPDQQLPLNAYVPLQTIQDALKQPGRASALLLARRPGTEDLPVDPDATSRLAASLQPSLDDYGLSLRATELGYWELTSRRMLIEPAVIAAAKKRFASQRPREIFTYLANTIADPSAQAGQDDADRDRPVRGEIPYSTITAIDFSGDEPQGPFRSPDGAALAPLEDGEIALNQWAVDNLRAQVGDSIRVDYFEPESVHGVVREDAFRGKLTAIVALAGHGADRDLTPEVRGVTDEKSIADWDPPFPFQAGRVRKVDEDYWDRWRTVPKAYISLATGQRLWQSRFGRATGLALDPAPDRSPAEAAAALAGDLPYETMGLRLLAVKQQGLAAARGTTPFNALFLGFSMFLLAAAVMLVALLFRLGVEQRSRELGLLRALGFSPSRVRRLLAGEGAIVAVLGAAAGAGLGLGYAWLMLAGLRTWWLAAVTTPFLQLHWSPVSLGVGFVAGVATSVAAMLWTLRRLGRLPVRRLLAGQVEASIALPTRRHGAARWVALVMTAVAFAAGFGAVGLSGEAQAGAFFASGAALLTAWIVAWWSRLTRGESQATRGPGALWTGAWPLARLASRNRARHPGRSALAMGLVAAASFLIVAIGAFQLDPAGETGRRDSGSGGFALLGQTSQSIYQDLGSREARAELGFSAADEQTLLGTKIYGLRVRSGDDASCLNLYQPRQPRVLGIPPALVERGGFAWSGAKARSEAERENPWLVLDDDANGGVPGAFDENTAMYSLHVGLGGAVPMLDDRGRPFEIRVAGMLKNSVFQGSALVSEVAFVERFPDAAGYRYFLIETPAPGAGKPESAKAQAARVAKVRALLEDRLGDFGFTAERSDERLASLMAVQNTYLATFQTLGGLGLLLGVVGLAAVELRSVLERRSELALLRAIGFPRLRLAGLVLMENLSLLIAGLCAGVATATVAVLPHLAAGGSRLPWLRLGSLVGLVLAAGVMAGLAAAQAVLRSAIVTALREE